MLIQLEELFMKEDYRIERQFPWEISVFCSAAGEFPVTHATPIQLEILHNSKKRIQVDGSLQLTLGMVCDRCLKDVSYSFSIQFHKEIDCNNPESEDDWDDTQYIVDSSLDVNKIIRDEILLQWPAKVLCRKDCKGICRVCGHDLNVGDCGCDRVVLDPRMAAIQDIFKQGNADKEV